MGKEREGGKHSAHFLTVRTLHCQGPALGLQIEIEMVPICTDIECCEAIEGSGRLKRRERWLRKWCSSYPNNVEAK